MKAFILSLLFITNTFAAFLPTFIIPSAARLENESFEKARERNLVQLKSGFYFTLTSPDYEAQPWDEYKFPAITQWSDKKQIKEAFVYIRDTRFIDWYLDDEFFPRRSTWLYPDDGCFARADLAKQNAIAANFPTPHKVFAFGDLNVKTKNHPNGKVSWWYHVAPIAFDGKQYYVLDPALNYKKPLPLKDWLKLMNKDYKTIKIAICHPDSAVPNDDCYAPFGFSDQMREYQEYYLPAEWSRLVQLKRDPVKELGEKPPWKSIFPWW